MQVKVDSNKFQNKIDNPHLWNDASDHNHWITRLVTLLLSSGGVTDEVLLLVTPVCEVKVNNAGNKVMLLALSFFTAKVEFCELIFPMLIYNILANQNAECTAILTRQFSGLLKAIVIVSDGRVTMATNSSYIPSLRTIIDTILFLRSIDKPSERRLVSLCCKLLLEDYTVNYHSTVRIFRVKNFMLKYFIFLGKIFSSSSLFI